MWETFLKSYFKFYISCKWIHWNKFFICLCILFPCQIIWSYVATLRNIIKLQVVQKSHSGCNVDINFFRWCQTFITKFFFLSVYGNLSYDPAILAILLCISEMQYSLFLLLSISCHSYNSCFFLGCRCYLNKKKSCLLNSIRRNKN